MDNSPFSPVSPVTQASYASVSSPLEGQHPYTTPAHEGLQAVDEPPPPPPPVSPYSYQGQIQPDVVPLSVLGDKYRDDNLLPSYPERRIWGIRVRIFWTLVVIAVLVVIIAVGVGAGIGGAHAARHSKDGDAAASTSSSMSSSSTAPSSQSTSAASSAPSSSASSSAGSSASSTHSSAAVGATPVPFTGILPLDCPNIDGTTYSTSSSKAASFKIKCSSTIDGNNDIGRTFAPSLDGCIEDCASKATGCLAVVFNANLTLSNPLDGNCYFKNSTEGLHAGSYSLQASAIYA